MMAEKRTKMKRPSRHDVKIMKRPRRDDAKNDGEKDEQMMNKTIEQND